MPSLSVVAAITLPDGLINTTVTFAMPTLLASTIRPVTFTVDRKRAAAFLSASSDMAGAGAGSDFGVSAGAPSGVVVGCAAGVVVSGVVVAGVDAPLPTGADAVTVPSLSSSP